MFPFVSMFAMFGLLLVNVMFPTALAGFMVYVILDASPTVRFIVLLVGVICVLMIRMFAVAFMVESV